ncbi:ergothioneine biosynthesis protein EgtC [Actinopolymorpha alba]|uniref:ergothioneine biosynthesis protein EgtC n=1 Tax=Actinopolymorpha alba TaxID=533267 RepID=UPI000361D872|nr:ergothioneine biosynthesis protein EgtC [Actinopolymorpha alba]
MCRHLAYLGQPVSLQELALDPPYSLATQAYAPRRQRFGMVNVDGFGTGWYVAGRPEPVRYRRAQPIWSDQSFASLAPTIESTCVLAAVRSATPGFPCEESGTAPFTHGRWLFSHNGVLHDLPLARKTLRDKVAWVPDALAPVDSAILFGLAVAQWEAGGELGDGLAQTAREIDAVGGGRLNLLATDGERLAATAYGDTLFVRQDDSFVVIASEPYDDDAGWREVPPDSLVEADDGGLDIRPL